MNSIGTHALLYMLRWASGFRIRMHYNAIRIQVRLGLPLKHDPDPRSKKVNKNLFVKKIKKLNSNYQEIQKKAKQQNVFY